MKTIPPALDAHYATGSTTLARLWKVTRRDGQVFGFTDHDADIPFEGVNYRATSAFDAGAVTTRAELNVDSLELVGLISGAGITAEDIEAGLWDGAAIKIMQVNWADLTMGAEIIRVGTAGNIQRKGGQYTAEMRGLMQHLQDNIGRVITPTCVADLGDERCGVDLEGSPGYRVASTVSSVTSNRLFSAAVAAADGYYTGGAVKFSTGLNAGIEREIKTHTAEGSPVSSALLETHLPFPFAVYPGDEFTMIPGCDKTKGPNGCRRYSNIVNFRGFSLVPGLNTQNSIGNA